MLNRAHRNYPLFSPIGYRPYPYSLNAKPISNMPIQF